MDIREQLLQEHSKENTHLIADYIGKNNKRYQELWELVRDGEPPLPQRGSWVLTQLPVSDRHVSEMITALENPGNHDAVKRHLLKILSMADIPEDHAAALFDRCLDWLSDPATAVAVKVYCMDIATTIALPYPELREELKVIIEDQMKHRKTMGILSRGRKMLKKLECKLLRKTRWRAETTGSTMRD